MGKKKSFYKKTVKRFLKKHPTLLAGLAATASGIVIADALGIAKKILQSEDDSKTSTSKSIEKRLVG